MLRDVGSSWCFVSVATVSKCLGLDFPPAAVKGMQAGLHPVQTDVPRGDITWKTPFIQLHWDALPGAVSTCSPQQSGGVCTARCSTIALE